ncbi:MAG: TM2 domain-containing protein [Verrucomicrobiia bacterium]|jgi:TM2 domain-containing membrane protein YozV
MSNNETSPRANDTHSKLVGYLLWFFGFTGAHRFYFGKNKTGILWFFTGGFFLIGWLVDVFLIPAMDRQADRRFTQGPADYTLAWLFLALLGVVGFHRIYLGKVFSGILQALIFWILVGSITLTGLVFLAPLAYAVFLIDFLTLNQQVDRRNRDLAGAA